MSLRCRLCQGCSGSFMRVLAQRSTVRAICSIFLARLGLRQRRARTLPRSLMRVALKVSPTQNAVGMSIKTYRQQTGIRNAASNQGSKKSWSPWLQDSSFLTDFVLWVGSALAEEARRASGAPRSHNHPGSRCDDFVPELLNQLISNAMQCSASPFSFCVNLICAFFGQIYAQTESYNLEKTRQLKTIISLTKQKHKIRRNLKHSKAINLLNAFCPRSMDFYRFIW